MAIDTSGQYWRGENLTDLVGYLREFQAGGYPVADVAESVCHGCAGRDFYLSADDEEGCAQRVCITCDAAAYIADSEDHAEDADLRPCQCPCGGDTFAIAVGFARRTGQEIRWISIGVRCLTDGTLGVYANWKIDYAPTSHLLTSI